MPKEERKAKSKNIVGNRAAVRCAIYARCASETSRPTQISDQINRCRKYAEKHGWLVIEGFVKSDVAVSGRSVNGRNSLRALMQAVKKRHRPFDQLLIDDTSRLARNLADTLQVVEHFKRNGVRIVAASQGLDLSKDLFPLTSLAMCDELYLATLREKIRRGQQGCVLSGYIAGGRCYGYKNVPVEDPTRTGNHGRPYVGVRREIVPEQAEIVRRIFGMYASGHRLSNIAHALNTERVAAPDGHSNSWRSTTIASILRNQHYRGVIMWNRTRKIRSPETGECKTLVRPEAEWVRIEHPEWRIISEEMWKKVQAVLHRRDRPRK